MPKPRKQATALIVREARMSDLPRIVQMLADDELGAGREWYSEPLPDSYYDAFANIDADRNNLLAVAELDGRVVGTLQLTLIPYLSFQGGWRGLIEAVRVDSSMRRQGLGRELVAWAIETARARRCHLVQLTTNKQRADAKRFYERLGFVSSHEGLKLPL